MKNLTTSKKFKLFNQVISFILIFSLTFCGFWTNEVFASEEVSETEVTTNTIENNEDRSISSIENNEIIEKSEENPHQKEIENSEEDDTQDDQVYESNDNKSSSRGNENIPLRSFELDPEAKVSPNVLDVNAALFTGSLNTSIPFGPIPPGRNGLTPSIAITYSSTRKENGILGVGWDIAAYGFISISKNRGVAQPFDTAIDLETLEQTNEFEYNFNGTKGLLIKTQYGYYLPEINESFTKFEKVQRTPGDPNDIFWIAYAKNGMTYVFGWDKRAMNYTNIRSTIWLQDFVIDSSGNFIHFSYDNEGYNIEEFEEFYLFSISYTGKMDISPSVSVKEILLEYDSFNDLPYDFTEKMKKSIWFIREDREDIKTDYSYGFKLQQTERLEKIKLQITEDSGYATATEFEFVYEDELDEEWIYAKYTKSRLKEIIRKGYKDGQAETLPPITFQYDHLREESDQWEIYGASSEYIPNYLDYSYSKYHVDDGISARGAATADFNGDGLADIGAGLRRIGDLGNGRQIRTYDEQEEDWERLYDAFGRPLDLPTAFEYFDGDDSVWRYFNTQFSDFNGDGISDIWRPQHKRTNGDILHQERIWLNSNVGFTVFGNGSGNGLSPWGIFNPLYGNALANNHTGNYDRIDARLLDVNGDSLGDFYINYCRSSSSYGDCNLNRYIYVYLNSGNGWQQTKYGGNLINAGLTGYMNVGIRVRSQFIDLNGDGLEDIITAHNSDGGSIYHYEYKTHINTGRGFYETDLEENAKWACRLAIEPLYDGSSCDESYVGNNYFGCPIYDWETGQNSERDPGTRIFDINGDGLVDIIRKQPGVHKVLINTGNEFVNARTGSNVIKSPCTFSNSGYEARSTSFVNLNKDAYTDILTYDVARDDTVTKAAYINKIYAYPPDHPMAIEDPDHSGPPKDFLTVIDNGVGLKTYITYKTITGETSDPTESRYLPFMQHVVSEIENYEEVTGNSYKKEFSYFNPYYFPNLKDLSQPLQENEPFKQRGEFRGFGSVIEYENDRQIKTVHMFKQNINSYPGYFAGKILSQTKYESKDGLDQPVQTKYNAWNKVEIEENTTGTTLNKWYFPYLSKVTTYIYDRDENGSYTVRTQEEYDYDVEMDGYQRNADFGNVVEIRHLGGNSDVDYKEQFTYGEAGAPYYIKDRVIESKTLDPAEEVLRWTKLYYDDTPHGYYFFKGLLTKKDVWRTGTANPQSVYCTDVDEDGYSIEGETCGNIDCDDTNPEINPGAHEYCFNYMDDNCDGLIDGDDEDNCSCEDKDNDGYGEREEPGCFFQGEDCDDWNSDINPGVQENCSDEIDNNCDGLIDEEDYKCNIFSPIGIDDVSFIENDQSTFDKIITIERIRKQNAGSIGYKNFFKNSAHMQMSPDSSTKKRKPTIKEIRNKLSKKIDWKSKQSTNKMKSMGSRTTETWITTKEIQYNDYGLVTEFKNAKEIEIGCGKTTYSYETDEYTYPETVIDEVCKWNGSSWTASNFSTVYEFERLRGKIQSITDPNGYIKTYNNDGFGRLTKVSDNMDGELAKYEYDFESSPITITETPPAGVENTSPTIITYYDGFGRELESIREGVVNGANTCILSNAKEFDYKRRVIKEYLPTQRGCFIYQNPSDVGTAFNSYEYDALDRITLKTFPDGSQERTIYRGKEIEFQDANYTNEALDCNWKARQINISDDYGRIIEVRQFYDADNNSAYYSTHYEYYTLGELKKVTDPHQNEINYEYDSLGRLVYKHDDTFGTRYFLYDSSGNIEEIWDNNKLVTLKYDNLSRILITDSFSSDEDDIHYFYDEEVAGFYNKGKLTRIEKAKYFPPDPSSDEYILKSFNYDKKGRIKESTISTKGVDDLKKQINYDLLNRISSFSIAEPTDFAYGDNIHSYDNGGNLFSVTIDDNIGVDHIYYDQNGQITEIQYANEVITNYIYDESLRLILISTTNALGDQLQSLEYQYDKVGNVRTITDSRESTNKIYNYTYDDLYRLMTANLDGNEYNYQYDEIGNITFNNEGGENKTYNYVLNSRNQNSHKLINIDGEEIIYDNHGNFKQAFGKTFSFDSADRLTEVITQENDRITFNYDETGARIKKKKNDGEIQVNYLLDGLIERDQANNFTSFYYVGSKKFAKKDITSEQIYYYHTDHLQGSNIMTNENGEQVQEIFYYPFGKNIEDYTPDLSITDDLFTGQKFDDETGLYYFGARYYDPETGRFISPDPIMKNDMPLSYILSPIQMNSYAYAINNPLKYIDPTGEAITMNTQKQEKAYNNFMKKHPIIRAIASFFGYGTHKDMMQSNMEGMLPGAGVVVGPVKGATKQGVKRASRLLKVSKPAAGEILDTFGKAGKKIVKNSGEQIDSIATAVKKNEVGEQLLNEVSSNNHKYKASVADMSGQEFKAADTGRQYSGVKDSGSNDFLINDNMSFQNKVVKFIHELTHSLGGGEYKAFLNEGKAALKGGMPLDQMDKGAQAALKGPDAFKAWAATEPSSYGQKIFTIK